MSRPFALLPRNAAGAALYQTTAAAVLADQSLTAEVFGPSTLLVAAEGPAELLALLDALEGQLTATAHGTPDDFAAASVDLAFTNASSAAVNNAA